MDIPFIKSLRRPKGIEDTLYHVTHPKAGSSWLYRIFKKTYKDRVPQRVGGDTSAIHHVNGNIYSALFCNYETFAAMPSTRSVPHFFVMRDIRDTITSMYFSHRYSHVPSEKILKARAKLEQMSEEAGILHCFQDQAPKLIKTQRSWIESGAPVYRYEDLFESQGMLLLDILDEVGFRYDKKPLVKSIQARTFEKSFGRKPGEVDIHSHGRSGVAGSWQQHCTPQLEQFIDKHLTDHLQFTGYK